MPDQIRLAPFYDLMCTGVYEGINKKLAMKIGGENRPSWIRSRHWKRMAAQAGIGTGYVLRTVADMAARIVGAAEEVASEQQSAWGDALIIGRIMEVIAGRAMHSESLRDQVD